MFADIQHELLTGIVHKLIAAPGPARFPEQRQRPFGIEGVLRHCAVHRRKERIVRNHGHRGWCPRAFGDDLGEGRPIDCVGNRSTHPDVEQRGLLRPRRVELDLHVAEPRRRDDDLASIGPRPLVLHGDAGALPRVMPSVPSTLPLRTLATTVLLSEMILKVISSSFGRPMK